VIHVLDDEESLRVSLARLLEQAGYAVRSHASAGDFLLAEPDDGPACLLLDLALRAVRAGWTCRRRCGAAAAPSRSCS
jgi:FixJ family two-component response regulator